MDTAPRLPSLSIPARPAVCREDCCTGGSAIASPIWWPRRAGSSGATCGWLFLVVVVGPEAASAAATAGRKIAACLPFKVTRPAS
jgi:hypothetical protein